MMDDEFLLVQTHHYLNNNHAYIGLSQVISIAACDLAFATQLLADPAEALAIMPSDVQLSLEESLLIMSVRGAADISEFAALLLAHIAANAPPRRPCDGAGPMLR